MASNYRRSVESNLSTPPVKPITWIVYTKSFPVKWCEVQSKYWFEARKIGSMQLMISLEELDAQPCTNANLVKDLLNRFSSMQVELKNA